MRRHIAVLGWIATTGATGHAEPAPASASAWTPVSSSAPASSSPPSPPSPASALTTSPPPSLGEPALPRYAFAANIPLAWPWSDGISAWFALDGHQALRANAVRSGSPPRIFAEDQGVKLDFGTTSDLSIGWVYFPRQMLDGATLEADLLCRFRRTRDAIDDANVAHEERTTNTYGGRALVGWTWRSYGGAFFTSAAVGASYGYERGTEMPRDSGMRIHVSRADLSPEFYLRFGLAWGGDR